MKSEANQTTECFNQQQQQLPDTNNKLYTQLEHRKRGKK